MLFCDQHFEKEFLKIERWAQFLGIPLFTLFSVLFLMPYPFTTEVEHFFYHVVFSFAGVVAIWYSIRAIIFFFRKHLGKVSFSVRLSLQLVMSSVVTISIIYFLDTIGEKFF